MKSTISAIALVASFLSTSVASPLRIEQRDVVVDYVTDVQVVTVYATEYWTGDAAATSTSSSVTAHNRVKGKTHWTYTKESSSTSSTTMLAEPTTTSAAAPTSSSSSSSSSTSTSTSTSVYVAPTPSTTSVYVAPAPTSTYIAPSTPSTTATSSTMAPAYTAPSGPSALNGDAAYTPDNVKLAMLNSTNVWRAMFQAKPVDWHDDLAAKAMTDASTCSWEHTNAGQNLAAGYSGPTAANDGWGGEYTQFNFANPDFTESTGHFSQVVWQASTHIGCAAYNCPQSTSAQGWFLICNYMDVGNMLGEFKENVLPKVS